MRKKLEIFHSLNNFSGVECYIKNITNDCQRLKEH